MHLGKLKNGKVCSRYEGKPLFERCEVCTAPQRLRFPAADTAFDLKTTAVRSHCLQTHFISQKVLNDQFVDRDAHLLVRSYEAGGGGRKQDLAHLSHCPN